MAIIIDSSKKIELIKSGLKMLKLYNEGIRDGATAGNDKRAAFNAEAKIYDINELLKEIEFDGLGKGLFGNVDIA